MAFPTENNKRALAFVLTEAQGLALRLRREALAISAKSLTGELTASAVLVYQVRVKENLDRLEVLRVTAGIGAFAQEQFSDALFDIALEFGAVLDAVQAVLTWVRVNLPVSPSGFVEAQTIELDDSITERVFTSAQTSTFRTQLSVLINTIA